jgi:choice-of-anchor B domain-containing protein
MVRSVLKARFVSKEMSMRIRGLAANVARVLALAGALAASAHAQEYPASRVTLRNQIDVYTGVNDCWGYRAPNGTELAIYGHQTGTSFVNATNPLNATEIVNIPGATSAWRDMMTYSHYCYIVTEGGGEGTGLQIVDLANPLAPVLVSTYTANEFTTAHNLFIDVEAGILYAVGAGPSGGMKILSLANPVSPVELDYFTPYYIHDIFVDDGIGYAGAINSGTLRIIDLSNPSNPVTIATHSYPNAFTHNAWPNAAKTHCTTTDENPGGHLHVWDITDLDNIDLASEYEVPGPNVIHDVRIENDVAYISYYSAGARIVDLFDPQDPVEIGYFDTSVLEGGFNGDWGVYPFRSDDIFYASDRQRGLFILEFTGNLAGKIQGVVKDAATLSPLVGAEVELVEGNIEILTSIGGAYSKSVPAQAYTVKTTKFGYAPNTAQLTITERGTVTHNVNLSPVPFGSVKLTLTAQENGAPLPGVLVTMLDSPLATVVSNGAGEAVLNGVPAGPEWTLRLAKFGREMTEIVVVAPPNSQGVYPVSLPRGFEDDFEWNQGWIVGGTGDDATDGFWERDIPVGSYFNGVVGANIDASPTGEGYCYVTENHNFGAFVGTSDVDNGHTSLLTPVFNGSGMGTLTLFYQRWFSNRAPVPSTDQFRLDVSTNSGSSWMNLETISTGTDSWAAVAVPISQVSSTMQLRFVAEDLGEDTYVEGGVDDVRIVSSLASDAPQVVSIAAKSSLDAPQPNPIRESTSVTMHLARAGEARLEVYDVSGRRVAELLSGKRVAAGTYRVSWNGLDQDGSRVAAGMYFIRLTAPDVETTRKAIVLR